VKDNTPTGATLAATVLALDALYGRTPKVANDEPAYKWSDGHSAEELSDRLDAIAAKLVKLGLYEQASELKDAAAALCELDNQRDEARETVTRLVDEIRDLRDQLPRSITIQGNRYQPDEPEPVRTWEVDDND
jgi:hypothetical protein